MNDPGAAATAKTAGKWWRPKIKAQNIIAVSTMILALATFCLAKSAREQISIMRDDQRPWIGIAGDGYSLHWPYIGESDQIQFSLGFYLRNVGHAPAIVLVAATAELGSTDLAWRIDVSRECEQERDDIVKNGWGPRWAILPGDEWPYHLNQIGREVIMKESAADIERVSGNSFKPIVTGCIAYADPQDMITRTTGFVGTISEEGVDYNPDKMTPHARLVVRDDEHPLSLKEIGSPSNRLLKNGRSRACGWASPGR
jgi:hypothetical protein